jgi:hypothetical protein
MPELIFLLSVLSKSGLADLANSTYDAGFTDISRIRVDFTAPLKTPFDVATRWPLPAPERRAHQAVTVFSRGRPEYHGISQIRNIT